MKTCLKGIMEFKYYTYKLAKHQTLMTVLSSYHYTIYFLMRSASFHVHQVHRVGSFSLTHPVYPARLSYKRYKCNISKTAY